MPHPTTILKNSKRVLFIVHLAIGDFTYMQNCFLEFKKVYPNIKIDIFIQDVRMTSDQSKWPNLKNYILINWLKETGIFNEIYHAYSPEIFHKYLEILKKNLYDVTISLGDLRSQNYAPIAREIAQDKIAMGIKIKTSLFSKHKRLLKLLDIQINDVYEPSIHISDKFAYWFEQLGVFLPKEERYPKLFVPTEVEKKTNVFLDKKLNKNYSDQKIIFINIYAKGDERCWSKEQAFKLIKLMQKNPFFKNDLFFLNAPPEKKAELEDFLKSIDTNNIFIFTASDSFFELPALLKNSSLVITVDTSIMHLACVSQATLISLIRKKKKQDDIRWNPLTASKNKVIYTPTRKAPITSITVNEVYNTILSL